MTLYFYLVKTKGTGLRNVLLLSTLPLILGTITTNDIKRKLYSYKLYDFTKGGTDVMDQRIGEYIVLTLDNSCIFQYLDICDATEFPLNKTKTQNVFKFVLELATALITP